MGQPTLILASASPRRRELIARLGLEPAAINPADIDETPAAGERPRDYAIRMAREKAQAAATDDGFVLAGDTVVAAGRRILPKAEDVATARKCLELLSGRRHRVLSAIALRAPDGTLRERLCETVVLFKRLCAEEIDAYRSEERRVGLISRIQGSHSGVVGLPLYETRALLKSAGFQIV